MEAHCVFCDVGSESSYIIEINFSAKLLTEFTGEFNHSS